MTRICRAAALRSSPCPRAAPRWRAVGAAALAQRLQQLAIRTHQVDGVAGPEPGVAAGMQLDGRVPTSDRDDPGLGGHFEHPQPVELAAGRHVHGADHEGPLPDRERAQHLQAHRGADEPGRRQVDGGSDVFEPEPLGHRIAQGAVIDAQHDRHVGPVHLGHHPRPQHLAQHDPDLDVDHVVLGQHRDGQARSTRADSSVWRSVASPKITGTSSSAAVDRNRLFSSRSITATS